MSSVTSTYEQLVTLTVTRLCNVHCAVICHPFNLSPYDRILNNVARRTYYMSACTNSASQDFIIPWLCRSLGHRLGPIRSIYFSDSMNDRVVKMALNGTILQIFTVSNPPFNAPYGVTLDQEGNLFIADSNDNRIVKLSPTGAVLAVITVSDPSFHRPSGLSLDSSAI